MATAEQLKAMRKKAGIGEFAKKVVSKSKSTTKTSSSYPASAKKPVWDWDPVYLATSRFGGTRGEAD